MRDVGTGRWGDQLLHREVLLDAQANRLAVAFRQQSQGPKYTSLRLAKPAVLAINFQDKKAERR